MTVQIGYTAPPFCGVGIIPKLFADCLINCLVWDWTHDQHLSGVYGEVNPYIPDARCKVIVKFLESDAEWLWFLDYDINFPADTLEKLLSVADPIEKPIVGGVYFSNYGGGINPVWLQEAEHNGVHTDLAVVNHVNVGEVRECATVGMGCTLIHRSVLEKLAEIHSDDPWPWFGHDLHDTPEGIQRSGEDITFCTRARNAGFKVWGAANVATGHLKSHEESFFTYAKQNAFESVKQMIRFDESAIPFPPSTHFQTSDAAQAEPVKAKKEKKSDATAS